MGSVSFSLSHSSFLSPSGRSPDITEIVLTGTLIPNSMNQYNTLMIIHYQLGKHERKHFMYVEGSDVLYSCSQNVTNSFSSF